MSVPFNSAFIEKRMAEHKRRQHDLLNEMLKECLAEMADALESASLAKGADQKILLFPEPLAERQSERTRQ